MEKTKPARSFSQLPLPSIKHHSISTGALPTLPKFDISISTISSTHQNETSLKLSGSKFLDNLSRSPLQTRSSSADKKSTQQATQVHTEKKVNI